MQEDGVGHLAAEKETKLRVYAHFLRDEREVQVEEGRNDFIVAIRKVQRPKMCRSRTNGAVVVVHCASGLGDEDQKTHVKTMRGCSTMQKRVEKTQKKFRKMLRKVPPSRVWESVWAWG